MENNLKSEKRKRKKENYKEATSNHLDSGYRYVYILLSLYKVTSLFSSFHKLMLGSGPLSLKYELPFPYESWHPNPRPNA